MILPKNFVVFVSSAFALVVVLEVVHALFFPLSRRVVLEDHFVVGAFCSTGAGSSFV